ncbi:MAG: biotin transporter BioY [Clostridia bacterium]|nr:biotin transporter BioY [Clostridia bacterium]
MKTKDMTLIAVMAAVLCVLSPLSLSIGPIPLSLASFAVYLAGAVLGARRGTLAVGLYLLIGIVGAPVFSGFSGGFQKLAGVTGGYLVGYLPCALITGLGADCPVPRWKLPVQMILGTGALYSIGTAWFMLQTHNPLGASLGMCVIPFLPGDAVKIILATLIAPPIRRSVFKK